MRPQTFDGILADCLLEITSRSFRLVKSGSKGL